MNEPDDEQFQEIRKRIGTVLLLIAGVMSVLIFIDRSGLNIMAMPAFWYRSRALHLLICIGFFLGGLFLLRSQGQAATFGDDRLEKTDERRPLFDCVRFYSRVDCPLCDEAVDILKQYDDWMPEIEFVDIAGDQVLEEQHGEWIPVIEIDGLVRFRGRVDTVLLQRLIVARQRGHDGTDREQSP